MATEPITTEIIIQLMFIAVIMVFFGMLLNKILGVKTSKMKEIRDKAKNLQQRVRQAEILGDTQLLQQLNLETMQLMKQMLIKQIIPLLVRCVIFIGIFIVISMIYSQYEYWFWIYFLFSFTFSMIAMGVRYLYKKTTGKEDKRKVLSKEIMQTVYPKKQSLLHLPGRPEIAEPLDSSSSKEEIKSNAGSQESDKKDAWRDRIQN